MVRSILVSAGTALVLMAAGALPAAAADGAGPPACAAAPATAVPSVRVGRPFQLQLGGAPCDCAAIVSLQQVSLLIRGLDTGLHPLSCDPATARLTFILNKDSSTPGPATDAAWEAMLGDFWTGNGADGRRLSYSLVQSNALLGNGSIDLQTWGTGNMVLGIALLLAVWLSLCILGKRSGMVRDAGSPATANCARTYSLARVQMAWWFAIVIGAYIFLRSITGQMPALSAQALALAGLSGATGLAAASLDAGQNKKIPCSSGHLLLDLLTDADGITIYRFQLLVANMLFGLFFLISVLRNLTMPELDPSILTLLGISSATYTGFKIPERHGPPPGTNDPAAAIAQPAPVFAPVAAPIAATSPAPMPVQAPMPAAAATAITPPGGPAPG